MAVHYRDRVVGRKRVDFVVEGVMVEIKARAQIEDVDIIQTLSYLKASEYVLTLKMSSPALYVNPKVEK